MAELRMSVQDYIVTKIKIIAAQQNKGMYELIKEVLQEFVERFDVEIKER